MKTYYQIYTNGELTRFLSENKAEAHKQANALKLMYKRVVVTSFDYKEK